jgi:aminobenzoyl-glutamate utilization protein B
MIAMQTVSRALVGVLAALASALATAADPDPKVLASRWLDARSDRLAEVNRRIWSYAETSLAETRSAKELKELLAREGFRVESGVAGMPTAFVATYGTGRPVIGILAEYDALPGVSQAALPQPAPGPNPAAGHACGHSAFGVGSAGAAMAIARLIADGHIKGTVRLYGTPAEETAMGKIYMLRAGFFRDDDAVFAWHPGSLTLVPYGTSKAMVSVKFRFRGSAAHAAAQPYAGRSALDAVELMSAGVNAMREHVREDARIHYVITRGGDQPNVVPAYAEVWYYIRADRFTDVVGYFEWVRDIAEGAARMTRTELEAVAVESEMHEVLPLRSLAEVVHRNLTAIGPPAWSEQDLAFARATQRNFRDPGGTRYDQSPTPLSDRVEPLSEVPIRGAASTDVGDVSWFVPVGNVMVAGYGYGLPTHSWPVAATMGTPIADRALLTAAKTIAASAIDLYLDPELLARVQADFRAARGEAPWQTLIPEGQVAPASVR